MANIFWKDFAALQFCFLESSACSWVSEFRQFPWTQFWLLLWFRGFPWTQIIVFKCESDFSVSNEITTKVCFKTKTNILGNQFALNPQKCDTTFHNIALSTDTSITSKEDMANTLKGFKAHKTPPNQCTTRLSPNGNGCANHIVKLVSSNTTYQGTAQVHAPTVLKWTSNIRRNVQCYFVWCTRVEDHSEINHI